MATHNRDIVDKINRRVINMEHGQVVRDRRRGRYHYK